MAACGPNDSGFNNVHGDGGARSDSSAHDSSPPVDEGVDTGTVTSADGFGASRAACITKINQLRATDTAVKLKPYKLVNTTTTDTCVDKQASNDEAAGIPHDSFNNMTPWCGWALPPPPAMSMYWGQDECGPGYGTSVAGIEKCLQDMWDESLKPHCLGCVGCTAYGGKCPNCDAPGLLGYECGHYVNMSAPYFSEVACGFAGAAPSSQNGWAVQNFE